MTTIVRPSASVTIGGVALPVLEGRISLDERRVPYVAGEITLPASAVEQIVDATQRVIVTGADANGDARTFDCGLDERQDRFGTRGGVTLRLLGDERLLQQYAPLVDDNGIQARASSVRSAVGYVLGKIDAQLTSAGPDLPLNAEWDLTNHATNPGPRVGVDGWFTSTSDEVELVPVSGPPEFGGGINAAAVTLTEPASDAQLGIRTVRISPRRTVSASLFGQRSSAGSLAAVWQWLDIDGQQIAETVAAPQTVGANEWRRVALRSVAPAGAVEGRFSVRAIGALDAGAVILGCRALLVDGPDAPAYFDGNTPDDARYVYTWTGDPEASASVRAALNPADPDALLWQAGMSAWDFLTPLIASIGLMLYCDEARVWHLIDPTEPASGDPLDVSDAIVERTDTTRPADSPTGVVIVYRWKNRDGIDQERRDIAGEPGRVHRLEFDRAFPGVGLASRILAARANRGRSQQLEAAARWGATPRTPLTSGGDSFGRVRAVEWPLLEGFMTITRDETD